MSSERYMLEARDRRRVQLIRSRELCVRPYYSDVRSPGLAFGFGFGGQSGNDDAKVYVPLMRLIKFSKVGIRFQTPFERPRLLFVPCRSDGQAGAELSESILSLATDGCLIGDNDIIASQTAIR